MSQMTRLASTGCVVLTLCGALFGCSARTYVSGTGSTPSQFTHVFITTQEVWFNTSANATPDDSGWSKFTLTTPVTIDLVQESNGTLGQIAGDLRLAPGTYSSILLMPLANVPDGTPATSASALGAANNLEADYVDTSGNSHQVALVIPNPEKGIVVTGTSLKVPVGGASLGSTGSTSTTGTTASTTSTTTSTTGTTSSTSSTNNTVTVSFAANFDANRDLHLFNYPVGTTTAQSVLMGPNPVATDLSTTGGISGTLTLTNLTGGNINSVSDRVAIQASAELLSTDGSHHYIVATAPVQTDGTFTIYPLQSNSSTPTVYDVVIHGPGIETIIIKNVSVATTTPSLAAAADTTGSVATTTASGAVSLGTFIPNPVSTFYVSPTPPTGTTLPTGTAVTFYQTLPAKNEVPYAIDEVGIDPFNQNLQTPEALGMGSIESGVYASTGATITVTSSLPVQGAGGYLVGATAPLFTDAALLSTNQVVGATTAVITAPLPAAIPSPTPVTSVGSITAAVTTTSNLYNAGELLVSHNGAVIGSTPLDSALAGSGGSVTINNIPSGQGNYYLSAILWTKTSPGAVVYQSIAAPVTVSAGSATSTSVSIE